MAFKIGFITFTALDGPSPTEYAAYKKVARLLEPDGHVKSLAESHPFQPPMRFEHPAINRTPDKRLYKLAAELAPWMDEFHSRVLDRARIRERLKMIERTRFQNDMAEIKYYRQVDRLHAWITELLFERVYRRVGRNIQMFEKVAQREWQDSEHWHKVHKDERLKEAKNFPELHKKELVHPYRFEVKVPNDKKKVEILAEHTLADRQLLKDARQHAHQLRILLHDIIFDEVKMELKRQYVNRTDHYEQQQLWHMHDVLRAFDKAWMHAWDSRDSFRDLVRSGIFEQAALFPKLFQKALVDPWEVEIREPNDKHHYQKVQDHIDAERRQQKLVQLEAEAGRQLLRQNKVELAAYRNLASEQLDAKQAGSRWQEHVLVERSDWKNLDTRDYVHDAKIVESQGYQLLAGRMIPQPRFRIDADLSTPFPLAMGINGDPRAPEHIAPSPLHLLPSEQKENWTELRVKKDLAERAVTTDEKGARLETNENQRHMLAGTEHADIIHRDVSRPESPAPNGQGQIRDGISSLSRTEALREYQEQLPKRKY